MLHKQLHWICVVACQQHVDIGWVRVVSSVHLFFMIIRRVFVVELRTNRGHFVVGAAVFYSNNASVKLEGHQQQEHLGDTPPRRSSQTN